jgi:large conductance mechanosensitive channel
MLEEFKNFAIKGSVVDLAVGVVIGGAFGKIVTSLVDSIIMPPIGLLLGGVDFSELHIVLKGATEEAGAVVLSYGSFLNTVVQFFIVAFAIFIIVKQLNRFKKKEEVKAEAPKGPSTEELLTEIRDVLKKTS